MANERREPPALRFEPSALKSRAGDDLGFATVRFDPETPTLLPGETKLIRLSLELPPGDLPAHSELRVDAWAGRERALLLWIEIEVKTPSRGATDA